MKKLNKGFTLIELLVVIAIIGILASIVLASLGTARSKGNDAKVQGQLESFRSAAEIYYANNGSYGASGTGLCGVASSDTTGLYNLEQSSSYPTGTGFTCNISATLPSATYRAYGKLSAGTYFCVDNTGIATTTASAPASTANCSGATL